MFFGILQSCVHFPILIYHILSGLNIRTDPMQSTFDKFRDPILLFPCHSERDLSPRRCCLTSGDVKMISSGKQLKCAVFASFILLFFYNSHICLFIFPFLFSSLTVSWWSDTLESDPRDTRFCISWPLITVGEFSEWTDLINCFWNQFVKKSRKHAWILQLPPTVK